MSPVHQLALLGFNEKPPAHPMVAWGRRMRMLDTWPKALARYAGEVLMRGEGRAMRPRWCKTTGRWL